MFCFSLHLKLPTLVIISPICTPLVCSHCACHNCSIQYFAWAVHVLCLANKSEVEDGIKAIKHLSVMTMEKWLLGGQQKRGTHWAASGATRDVPLTSQSASLSWEGRASSWPSTHSSSSLGQLDHLLPVREGAKPLLLAGRTITRQGGDGYFHSTTWCPRCG